MNTFAQIQQKLEAPKGQFNTFGKYKYRSCEDILAALKPILGAWVLTVNDEIVLIGKRYYVKATATCSLTHTVIKKDETIEHQIESYSSTAFAREALDKRGMDDAQITGSASSYARKYALNGLFCIDDTQDADTQDNTKKEPVKKAAPQNNDDRLVLIEKIRDMIGERIEGMNDQEKGKFVTSLGLSGQKDLLTKNLQALEAIVLKLEVPW